MVKNTNSKWIDNHLKFIIAKKLDKNIEEITKDFLKTLKEIDLSDCNISSLKGIQYANNLTSINLNKNEIINASLLSKLHKLTTLELSENKIEDISFLNNLKRIKNIGLDSNNISYINNLSNLKNLNLINVSNNKIKNLSFINTIQSKNIKIIASEQCVILEPIIVNYGEDCTFESPIYWNNETMVLLDNIQFTGKYDYINANKRPSFLYSISKVFIKSIRSNCLLKADFYHEVPFFQSGILSGLLIQPIHLKSISLNSDIFKTNKVDIFGSIYGKLQIKDVINNNFNLKSKVITIISSEGKKTSSLLDSEGSYEFLNLKNGRYTILFPFLDEYKYVTPSLYICNLNEGERLEINSMVIKF